MASWPVWLDRAGLHRDEKIKDDFGSSGGSLQIPIPPCKFSVCLFLSVFLFFNCMSMERSDGVCTYLSCVVGKKMGRKTLLCSTSCVDRLHWASIAAHCSKRGWNSEKTLGNSELSYNLETSGRFGVFFTLLWFLQAVRTRAEQTD